MFSQKIDKRDYKFHDWQAAVIPRLSPFENILASGGAVGIIGIFRSCRLLKHEN